MVDWSFVPWDLSWDDVDPRRHPFDTETAPGIVRSLAPAVWKREPHPDSFDELAAERFGLWARGWRWSLDEGDYGGGPISAWCCESHSVSHGRPEETVQAMIAGLLEWRLWIEDLAARFERYPLDGLADGDKVEVWERGAAHLIHQVMVRTEAGDAWYNHCAQVLRWYLARWGVTEYRAEALVEQAIGGRFESWIAADQTLVDDVARRLADSLDGPFERSLAEPVDV